MRGGAIDAPALNRLWRVLWNALLPESDKKPFLGRWRSYLFLQRGLVMVGREGAAVCKRDSGLGFKVPGASPNARLLPPLSANYID